MCPASTDPVEADEILGADEAQASILVERPPDVLSEFTTEKGLAVAKRIATQLTDIVVEQELSVRIGNSNHWKVEAWLALGSMVGIAPRTVWVEERRHPDTKDLEGYEARVETIRVSDGQVIGTAQASCFFDEEMWSKKERRYIKRWKERHAVESMSQTRATSKAVAQCLRWIPVLAGYSGTPLEEMPMDERARQSHERERKPQAPRKARAPKGVDPKTGVAAKINPEQAKPFWVKAYSKGEELGVTREQVTEKVRGMLVDLGFESTKDLDVKTYEDFMGIYDEAGHQTEPGHFDLWTEQSFEVKSAADF